LLAFALAVAPLIVALGNTTWQVDKFFAQSVLAVYRASRASEESQNLLSQINEMERSARQFQVLADTELWTSYLNRRTQFLRTLDDLDGLSDSTFLRDQLKTLGLKEQLVYNALERMRGRGKVGDAVREDFAALSNLASFISTESRNWINSQVVQLSNLSDETQRMLVWQASALAFGTLLLAVLLSNLVAKPVRQLDHAIRTLGAGRFDEEVRVTGPSDLRSLGERLNWLRHRLQDLEEKKGNFLRHVSHELKTPLTALREGSALLSEGFLGQLNRQQREVADVLQRNALSLQRMIENLLSFNMVEAKRSTLDVKSVDLHEIIDNVLADNKLALISKKIDLRLRREPVTIDGDAEKLSTVIDNLISNAIKYSPEGGTLEVTLTNKDRFAVLDVIDQGSGIREEDAGRVFEAFYRGQGGGTVRGSGLGLAITKEFVDLHSGVVEVITGRAKGAHFRVSLPIVAQQVVA
jgi:two-component system sensor histidine kinase GlrK